MGRQVHFAATTTLPVVTLNRFVDTARRAHVEVVAATAHPLRRTRRMSNTGHVSSTIYELSCMRF